MTFSRRSTRAPARRWLCLVLAAALEASALLPTAAWAEGLEPLRLPGLGESASDEFNLNTEKRVGEQIMREIRRDPDYLDDPQLLEYVQGIWRPLVAAARQRGSIGPDTDHLFPYELFLVRDRSVNAFALPGGYVGVHLALIALTATPDELASVLAHELSHITQRHIARSVSASSRSSSLGLAAMLLGLLVASRASSPDAAQAAIVGGQAAMAQAQLNFSRDMEREADRTGLALMGGAGFAPVGMVGMFDKLDQNSRLNDSGGFPYLRSHPLTVERIGEARQTVQASGGSLTSPPAPWLHTLMQVRARVLMDPSVQAMRRLQELDTRADMPQLPWIDRLTGVYGGTLASIRLRDFARAERSVLAAQLLLREAPSPVPPETRCAVDRLSAQLALARGQASLADAALVRTEQAGVRSRVGLLLRADWALLDGQPDSLRHTAESLQIWVAEHRDDASAWQALSLLEERQGHRLRAIRAEAESQAALGNLTGAMDRLRAGQRAARQGGPGTDFIEASVIDSRLRDLVAQRRQMLAEERQERGPRGGPSGDPQE